MSHIPHLWRRLVPWALALLTLSPLMVAAQTPGVGGSSLPLLVGQGGGPTATPCRCRPCCSSPR